jgi:hypothetical protein
MDILDFLIIIILITILYTLNKEDTVIENFSESIMGENKIQFALRVIKQLIQPKHHNPLALIKIPDDYTLKVDRIWIDDEFLIQDRGDGNLTITRNKISSTPYT